jgi:hypothetical protein
MRITLFPLALHFVVSGVCWSALHPQTEILTQQGMRPVGQLSPGELVHSMRATKPLQRAVAAVGPQKLAAGFVLSIESGGELLCSTDQLFWTARGWLQAEDLQCGDLFLSADGSWKSLLFPPLAASVPTTSLSLTPLGFDDPEEDRVMWVGPARILCHNDCVLIPLVTVTLGSGEILYISAGAFAAAAATLGTWWLANQTQEIAHRFGHPDSQTLQLSRSWLQDLQHADDAFLSAASWQLSETTNSASHRSSSLPVHSYQPLLIAFEELPTPLQERLRAQLAQHAQLPTDDRFSPVPITNTPPTLGDN